MNQVTPEEVQRRFDRLTAIFSDIVVRADAQAASRCPYRDRHDRCTAQFRCRNQIPVEAPMGESVPEGAAGAPPARVGAALCGHDGAFDYRDAWESSPGTADVARERLRRVRADGNRRRAATGDDAPDRD